ncbi:MAG TPA: 4'-phosphopantetheinyl transferase superfamily protein [Nocardioides sp.]|uniref:4'-phosphopantetheinyl transferase family protein n=1 Tax=Nocardioides sp. TaxID=35761 RepID=UPI002B550C8E|nr:4'-phosphopantetheinyl transferase superfamily protein [Nocardioides sp.]HQR26925.1 4'-phosphopantetheinyl transferase superfamily protein [Nocardioides sp.]
MRWLSCCEESLPAEPDWLSAREAAYLETIRFTKRRTEFLLRRHTGKRAVAAALGWPETGLARIEILNRLTGAPYVQVDGERAALDISLTDRAGWAVALVGSEGSMAAGTLGVDLEIAEPRSDGFVSDFLTPREQEYVAAQGDRDARDAAANLVWSAKEAALKVLRVGLRVDTRTVEVEADHDADAEGWRRLVVRHVEGQEFPGWWRRDADFVLTIAGLDPAPPPARLPGGDDLAVATPLHSWVTNPLVGP